MLSIIFLPYSETSVAKENLNDYSHNNITFPESYTELYKAQDIPNIRIKMLPL